MSQLELRPDWTVLWQDDRRLLRQMAEAIGLKTVAYELDVAPSQLAHALDERERNLPARWIGYLVTNAPAELGDEYVRRLAKLRGLDVHEAKPPSPEEELAALKAALTEELGAGARAAVMTRAATIQRGRRKR